MKKVLTILLICVFALTACDGGTPGTPTSVPLNEWEAQLVYVTPNLGPQHNFALSPDGSKLLTLNPRPDFTLHDLSTGTTRTLELPVKGGIDLESVAFAPDGNAFIYTEDLFTKLRQSDVHLYDLASNTDTNLTRNQIDHPQRGNDVLSSAEARTYLAWRPAWAADGQAIYYAASADGFRSQIRRIPRSGGEPTTVYTSTFDFVLGIQNIAPNRDGKRIAYTWLANDLTNPDNGVYVVNADGSDNRQITKHIYDRSKPKQNSDLFIVMPGQAYGSNLLLEPSPLLRENPQARGSIYAAYRSGDSTTLLNPYSAVTGTVAAGQDAFVITYGATWSPDGKRIAFIAYNGGAREGEPQQSLWLYDVASREYAMVYASPVPGKVSLDDSGRTLTWAVNDRLAIRNGDDSSFSVLQLTRKDAATPPIIGTPATPGSGGGG